MSRERLFPCRSSPRAIAVAFALMEEGTYQCHTAMTMVVINVAISLTQHLSEGCIHKYGSGVKLLEANMRRERWAA